MPRHITSLSAAAAALLLPWTVPATWAQAASATSPDAAPKRADASISASAPAPATRVTLAQALATYERGDLPGAERQFRQLSRQGVALGDYNLAMMHLRSEVPKPDPRLARELLMRAAGRGLVRAELALGQFFEQGAGGTPDLVRAQSWYLKAAEHGSADAQVAVATAFYLGRGAPQDPAQAAAWYREAAKAGDVGAQYLIASMYESGLGVDRDLRLARYWYDIAARNGDEAAPYKLKALDAALTADPGSI